MRCVHWLVFGFSVAATSCLDPVALPECESSQECPADLPVCADNLCFHHSVIAPIPWCQGGPPLENGECCDLLAGTALNGGGCAREVPAVGTVLAGPVWQEGANRFLAVVLGQEKAQLVEFDTGGALQKQTDLPDACAGAAGVQLVCTPSATWVSCDKENWLSLKSEEPMEWSWAEASDRVVPTLLDGEWAFRTIPNGIESYGSGDGKLGMVALPVGQLAEGLGSVGNARESALYVPLDGGERIGMVVVPEFSVTSQIGKAELESPAVDLALSDEGIVWVLTQDGSISAWEMRPGAPVKRRFKASGWGRPAPLAGTFAVAGESAWYLSVEGSLVTVAQDETVTAQKVFDQTPLQYEPLMGGGHAVLRGDQKGLTLELGFEPTGDVWGGAVGPVVRTRLLTCPSARLSQATPDGVVALGCADTIQVFAVSSPGLPGAWTQPTGKGGARCLHK